VKWISLLALETPQLPDFERLAAWYARRYPDAPPLVLSSRSDRLLTLVVGDDVVAVTLIGRPIPWAQLEGPAATAWYWPEATERLRPHGAHLLTALAEDAGDPLPRAWLLTRMTAALAAAAPCTGVFWGPGRLVHPPQAYLAESAAADNDDLPLFLWVDFRVEQLDGDVVRLYTTGLEALGGLELEAPHFRGDPQTLLEYGYNLAHYQLARKRSIGDGDTIALTDAVQATARRSPSLFGGDLEVIRLEFPDQDGSAPCRDKPAAAD